MMSSSMEGNEWGAVDLSGMVSQPAQDGTGEEGLYTSVGYDQSPPQPVPGARSQEPAAAYPPSASSSQDEQMVALIDAPLIIDLNEQTFEQAMALSATVPVVVLLYSRRSLASQQAATVMEDVARDEGGRFQLAKVDADKDPSLAAAFATETLPAAFAILAHRPIPLFEGAPTADQVKAVLAELFQVAPQLGVVGRIRVADEDMERPMPKEHEPARAAEMEGDWKKAIKAWQKVLASSPADKEAKQALARAKFELRYEEEEENEEETLSSQADALFAQGDEQGAFDLLFRAITETTDPEGREALRKQLVGLFQIASDPQAVKQARRKLATFLMV